MTDPEFRLSTDQYMMFQDLSKNSYQILDYYAESGDGKTSKYSAYFNGDTSKFLQVNLDYTPSGDFTWCGWFMKNRDTVSSYPIFMSFGLPYIACNSSSDPFRISYKNSAGSQVNLEGTTIPSLNTWYHVCITQDSGEMKIYINGQQENSTTDISVTFDGSQFEIGRHNNTDTYRIWGRADDVRLYKYALTKKEISEIINPETDPVKLSFKKNGDIVARNFEEDIDWELWNNWSCPSLDSNTIQFDSSINSRVLSSVASMQADGWTTYLTTVDTTSYTRKKGWSQQYYSSSPVGYIQKSLPAGYDMVRVRWGNYYTGTARVKIDGVTVQDLRGSEEDEFYTASYTGTPVFRIEESGIYWISEIWVGKSKEITSKVENKTAQDQSLICNGLSPNSHQYSTWTIGTGTVGLFNKNGDTAENSRKYAGDPWGQPAIIWNTYSTATSGADGGWNHTAVSIDSSKMYRYSVWVRRNNTNNGRFYHGCNGYGGTAGVYSRTSGSLSTNPYFYHSITGIPVNRWMLVVGHIWPRSSGTGSNYTDSGIYYKTGSKINITQDFVWHQTSTTGRGRDYLYYCTSTAQRQRFCYPLFEKCDGTEAPLKDLISGKAYNNIGRVPDETIKLPYKTKQSFRDDGKLLITGKLILK